MGWLDKLLGRGKDAASQAADTAGDAARSVQDKAEDAYSGAKERVSGDSETEIAEDKPAADAGEQPAEMEGRIPPGTAS